jgi:hypothetical protein
MSSRKFARLKGTERSGVTGGFNETAAYRVLRTYRSWILLGLVILLVVIVRVRLRSMPLERDEGEYAYAGQLMLQGIPPYKLAYNMKLPGTYGAYALMMLVFGQTDSGIHVGLMVVNVATIVLVFLLGRRILDENAGIVAAVTFAFLSLSPSVLGLQAHASHFGAFFASAGALVLLRAAASQKPGGLAMSGALFGCAFLMKQPGVFWAIFGFGYLVWLESQKKRREWAKAAKGCLWYGLGCAAPVLLMVLVLLAAGVFGKFWFWTFSYAREYVSANNIFQIPNSFLHELIEPVIGSNLLFWLLAALGFVVIWWDKRMAAHRVFVAGLAVASLAAVLPGWYFRQHYFVFVLPALGLLTGCAVSRAVHLVGRDTSIELFLSVGVLGIFGVALLYAVSEQGSFWFGMTPDEACRSCYRWQMFVEEAELGKEIQKNAPAGARIVVLGSEPQIYFYARRHSATGYIYTFPLMEIHKYALRMQQEMIREIEAARPEYLIFVKLEESWGWRPGSEQKLLEWYEQYNHSDYDLVKIIEDDPKDLDKKDPLAQGRRPGQIFVYQRKGLLTGSLLR